MRLKLIIPIILLSGFMSFAQATKDAAQNTDFQSYFSIKAGVNAVDSAGDSSSFDSFSDTEEMAFTSPYALGVDYRFSRLLSVGLFGSVNKWVAADGDIIDYVPVANDVDYFAIDANLKLYVDELLYFLNKGNRNWLDIYASAGAGYFSERESSVSVNLGAGANLWITNKFGVTIEGMGKFAGKEDMATNHFQYFAGLTYRFLGSASDADNDGIKDSKDECPNVPGVKENKGCPKEVVEETKVEEVKPEAPKEVEPVKETPKEVVETVIVNNDSDNDGVTDAFDQCPNEPGSLANFGCPNPIENTETNVTDVPSSVAKQLLDLSKKIRFGSNKGEYTPASINVLNRIVALLKQHPNAKFSLVGHTDATASVLYNQGLSIVRANNVKDYLLSKGITNSNYTIAVDGRGEEEPIASNLTIDGRLLNRRVELIVKTIEN